MDILIDMEKKSGILPALVLVLLVSLALMVFFPSDSFGARPLKMACVSDEGYGEYSAVLQELVGDVLEVRDFGDYPCVNENISREVGEWLPDAVVLLLGANDSKSCNWNGKEEFLGRYLTMVDELRRIPTHPRIFLCIPPGPSSDCDEISDSIIFNGVKPVIESLRGRRWLDVVDCYSLFEGRSELLAEDGVHPGSEGEEVIAEAVYQCISESGLNLPQGKRVVFIGDSITDGNWGAKPGKLSELRDNYDMNHIYGHGFMSMCAAHYLSKYPERRYSFFNRGIGGDNLKGIDGRWEKDVMALHPDVVSILVGVNDTWGKTVDDFDFETWESTYRSLIDRTLAVNPEVRFILCTPFLEKVGAVSRNKNYVGQKAAVDRLAEIVRGIASDYGLVLVPFDEEMDRLFSTDKSGDIHYWTWDGVHPTYQAHTFLSKLWIRKVGKL